MLWWTIAGAAAIFVYTLITLGLYISTVIHNGISNKISRRANEINRQSFVAVQRAFVNVVDLKVEHGPGLTPGEPGSRVIEAMYWTFTPLDRKLGEYANQTPGSLGHGMVSSGGGRNRTQTPARHGVRSDPDSARRSAALL